MPTAPPSLPCRHPSRVEGCSWCRIAAADPRYARLLGAPPPDANSPRPAPPLGACARLGGANGWTVPCSTCPRAVELKLFHCSKHGQCTVGKAVPGIACCVGCPDHLPLSAAQAPSLPPLPPDHDFPVRDCLYHLYPARAGAGAWRRCLGMLLARADLFTGRKVVSCMTGGACEPAALVRSLCEPAGFEVVELPNEQALREVKTLAELLPRFETDDPHRALFLGHAKGVTRPDNRGVTCHPWAAVCHEVCLDYWPLVESQLRTHPVTGPFKRVGHGFQGSRSAWHYSGSFAWVRSADLFARDWRRHDHVWYGIESYLSLHFAAADAGCLFHEAAQPVLNLYRMDYLREVLVEYAWWRAEHAGRRTREGVTA